MQCITGVGGNLGDTGPKVTKFTGEKDNRGNKPDGKEGKIPKGKRGIGPSKKWSRGVRKYDSEARLR